MRIQLYLLSHILFFILNQYTLINHWSTGNRASHGAPAINLMRPSLNQTSSVEKLTLVECRPIPVNELLSIWGGAHRGGVIGNNI